MSKHSFSFHCSFLGLSLSQSLHYEHCLSQKVLVRCPSNLITFHYSFIQNQKSCGMLEYTFISYLCGFFFLLINQWSPVSFLIHEKISVYEKCSTYVTQIHVNPVSCGLGLLSRVLLRSSLILSINTLTVSKEHVTVALTLKRPSFLCEHVQRFLLTKICFVNVP